MIKVKKIDFTYLALIILLFGLHTNLGFLIEGRYIPGIFILFSSILFFVSLRAAEQKVITLTFIFSSIILILNIMFTLQPGMENIERIFSAALILLSISLFWSIFLALSNFITHSEQKLYNFFHIITILISVGILFEQFTAFREFSNTVRSILYNNTFIYDSWERDIRDFGTIRPNFFSQEPSHLAKTLGLSVFALFALKPKLNTFLLCIFYFLNGILIIRSATLIPPMMLLLLVASCQAIGKKSALPILSFGASLIFFFSVINIDLIASMLPGIRAERIANFQDISAIERFLAPYAIAKTSLSHSFFFGLGVGSKEYFQSLVTSEYANFAHYEFHRLLNNGELNYGWDKRSGSNNQNAV